MVEIIRRQGGLEAAIESVLQRTCFADCNLQFVKRVCMDVYNVDRLIVGLKKQQILLDY